MKPQNTDPKICKICKEKKPFEAFASSGTNKNTGTIYRRPECKPCFNKISGERSRQIYYADLESARRKSREYARERYDSVKQRAYLYGVDAEEIQKLYTGCNGQCEICEIHMPTDWHVDHCHSTNKIRGILCRKCNTGLGFFADDVSLLQKAISYLKETSIE